ncbi:MAG: hypothetical protein SFV55_02895 [Haliscomenobacter sp.]|uniref:hypothetical protein n=1 Tax=Haliscomenobacter sp. TaxID=2717303 RepID=UPI0029BC48FA|nr:hypothetical protein [Haliscomenobacter sp.]MDX2067343.1 hypothetical protein [Haliscomenobacter sp.]
MKLLFLMILALLQIRSIACSCRLATIANEFQRNEAIFYGKHIETKYTSDYYRMNGWPLKIENFEVIRGYKGVNVEKFKSLGDKKYIVSVLSPCDESSCQRCFEPNKHYLVYSSTNPYLGIMEIDYCSRSREITTSNFTAPEYDQERGKDEQRELLRLSKIRGAAGESFFTILEKKDQEIRSLEKENNRLQKRTFRTEIALYCLFPLMFLGIFMYIQKR